MSVGGDWIASNLVAGAYNPNSGNGNFGDAPHDLKIPSASDNANIISKIASVVIGGQVLGTLPSVSAADHFGFVAEQIGAVKIGGNTIVIPTNNTPQPVGQANDVDIHIIP